MSYTNPFRSNLPSNNLSRRPQGSRGRSSHANLGSSNLGMPNFKYQQQFYESSNKGNVVPSFQDRLDSQLSQNIALVLIDRNYEHIDNHALFALTSIMKEYLLEIGSEMKSVCES